MQAIGHVLALTGARFRVPVGSRRFLIPDQLQTVARDPKTLAIEVILQARVELGDQVGVKLCWQIVNGPGAEATEVVVLVAARIVPRASPADARAQFGRDSDGHQGFEGLVHSRQTDSGNLGADGVKDDFRRRVIRGLAELLVHGEPLRSATQTGVLDDRTKPYLVERQGFHHCIVFPRMLTNDPVMAGLGVGCDTAVPGRNSFMAIAFLLFGGLTAVSTAC